MTTRAKFICVQKLTMIEGYEIRLEAVTSGSEENESFFRYTPSGQIDIGIVNEAASEQFEVGKEFYVTFEEAKI